jgi:hypothetical protein
LLSPVFVIAYLLCLAFPVLGLIAALEGRNRLGAILLALLGGVPCGLVVWISSDHQSFPTVVHVIAGLPALIALVAVCIAAASKRRSRIPAEKTTRQAEQSLAAESR